LSRRRYLPALSAVWLVVAASGWLALGGVFGTLPVPASLLVLGVVLGLAAFVGTGWLMAAQDRFRPKASQPVGQATGLLLDDLLAMSPGEFEDWVKQLFRSRGYFAHNTPDSADHGIDLRVVSPQGEPAIVQCKRYRGVVGEAVVRDLYGVMQHEGVARGFLVTTGSISAAAGRWAQDKPIELIDGPRLERLASAQADPAEPLVAKVTVVDV
jgi:hypothetical protein